MYKVSVVIPTLNRAEVLAGTIDRIQHQTIGRDLYEVLVIDNNSSDDTQQVLAAKSAAFSNLRTFSQNKPGAAATRNIGIREASGDLVLFIDDDIFAEPDLIAAHCEYHRSAPAPSSIIGTVVAPWSDTSEPFLRYLRDKAVANPYNLAHGGQTDFSAYHTGNVSTPLKVLRETGGFDEGFSVYGMEDIELGYRLEKSGCRMTRGVAARAKHEYFPTFEWFVKRCRQAGYSLGRMIQLHPELGRRFTESGKYPRVLKGLHSLYPMFLTATDPLCKGLVRWERQRGSGAVSAAMQQHYYWAIRYNFYVGYRDYVRNGLTEKAALQPGDPASQSIPKLAIERHD